MIERQLHRQLDGSLTDQRFIPFHPIAPLRFDQLNHARRFNGKLKRNGIALNVNVSAVKFRAKFNILCPAANSDSRAASFTQDDPNIGSAVDSMSIYKTAFEDKVFVGFVENLQERSRCSAHSKRFLRSPHRLSRRLGENSSSFAPSSVLACVSGL